jgi:hypothetical protein
MYAKQELSTEVREHWNLPVGQERLAGTYDDWRTTLGVDDMNPEAIKVAKKTKDPPICLPSASPTIGAYEAEISFISEEGTGIGIDPAIVTRVASLAPAGAIVVGRSEPWESATRQRQDIFPLRLPDNGLYYTMEALIITAAHQPELLSPLIDRLKANPHTPIDIYTLDETTEIFLLWLQKQSGIEEIFVNANSKEIAQYWNSKHILYPGIKSLDVASPLESLCTEARLPILPGVHIRDVRDIVNNLGAITEFFKQRGISTVCIKPCRGTDGSMITTNVPLSDLPTVLSRQIYTDQVLGVVIEPHIEYSETEIDDVRYPLALSAHILGGQVPPQITLQFMSPGGEWRGNISIDPESCEDLSIPLNQYHKIQATMQKVAEILYPRGLIKGGIDWAVGMIDGVNHPICAPVDPNLRANGGELLHKYLARQEALLGKKLQAATRVIKPLKGISHQQIDEALHECSLSCTELTSADTIAVVPPGWGMIGTTSTTPIEALRGIIIIENYLRKRGLVK